MTKVHFFQGDNKRIDKRGLSSLLKPINKNIETLKLIGTHADILLYLHDYHNGLYLNMQ